MINRSARGAALIVLRLLSFAAAFDAIRKGRCISLAKYDDFSDIHTTLAANCNLPGIEEIAAYST